MDEDWLIAVSPRHSVRLAQEYRALIERPPRRDYVVRTIAKREANGNPLMLAETVIAGQETREQHALAATYPLHFRKTYFPGRLHGDPKDEYERQLEASAVVGLPPPIGYAADVFRSCLLPGKPYNRLSPFGTEPEDSNLRPARELHLAAAAGLWRLAEEALRQLLALQAAGLAHGDPETHNLIVCPSPLELLLIDFESAMRRDAVELRIWEKRCAADLVPLLREAVFLQCSLGPQTGELAELSFARMNGLFRSPERFRREIDRQADIS